MTEEADKPKESRMKKALSSAGASMREQGQRQTMAAEAEASSRSDEKSPNSSPRFVDSYKRGGTVRKDGNARLHKGEKLIRRKKGRKSGRL